MSIRSLADFMEVSPRSVRRLACTATVTGRGDPQVDASARGADFWWPRMRTSGGHQCGLFMAKSADFLVATDTRTGLTGVRVLPPELRTRRWLVHRAGRRLRQSPRGARRPAYRSSVDFCNALTFGTHVRVGADGRRRTEHRDRGEGSRYAHRGQADLQVRPGGSGVYLDPFPKYEELRGEPPLGGTPSMRSGSPPATPRWPQASLHPEQFCSGQGIRPTQSLDLSRSGSTGSTTCGCAA